MALLRYDIEGWKSVKQLMERLGPARALPKLRLAVSMASRMLVTRLRSEYLSGPTTDRTVSARSGKLRQSLHAPPAIISGDAVVGGVSAGVKYAKVHIGPRGKEWVIKPRNVKYLTIPLTAALTRAGVLRGSARSEAFGDTFVNLTKAGNLIIFGRRRIMKGARAGKTRGKIMPLFLLKKSVTIPTRVALEEIIPPAGEDIVKYAKKELIQSA